MEINANTGGIGSFEADQGSLLDKVDGDDNANKPGQKANKAYQQQFKQAVAAPTDEAAPDEVQSEVSTTFDNESKEVTKQANQLKADSELNLGQQSPDAGAEDMGDAAEPDGLLKKLKEKSEQLEKSDAKTQKAGKSKTLFGRAVSEAGSALLSKMKKKELGQKDALDGDDESIEGESEGGPQETGGSTSVDSGPALPMKQANVGKQQQLFSKNFQSTLNFMQDASTYNKKFSPEVVIYDDENGYVDAEETLETLGWEGIAPVKEKLSTSLDMNALRNISKTKELIEQAKEEGISLYNGNHPVLSRTSSNVIAVEMITGELTIIKDIQSLLNL
jgi:hypothetical protein